MEIFWGSLENHKLTSLAGQVKLEKAVVQPDPEKEGFSLNYASSFNAISRDGQWHLSNQVESLQIGGRDMNPMQTQFLLENADDGPKVSLWVSRLNL